VFRFRNTPLACVFAPERNAPERASCALACDVPLFRLFRARRAVSGPMGGEGCWASARN
jgi:hypothetical protein